MNLNYLKLSLSSNLFIFNNLRSILSAKISMLNQGLFSNQNEIMVFDDAMTILGRGVALEERLK